MRNVFILFSTTFTITVLTLTLTTWSFPTIILPLDSRYIVLLAVSSFINTLFILLMNRLPIESNFLRILIDNTVISIIVFTIGVMINLIPVALIHYLFVLVLVVLIYFIITLIYLFILSKQTEDMNEKITKWRERHAGSPSSK